MLTNKKREEKTDLKGLIRINCQTNLIGQKTIDQTKKVTKRLEMILPAVKGSSCRHAKRDNAITLVKY